MKKILSILGATTLSTTSVSVVACGEQEKPKPTPISINLAGLSDTTVILTTANKTVTAFKATLVTELKNQQGFNNLTESDVDITKSNGSDLQNSDIVQGQLNTKVSTKKNNSNFIGEKTINVTITIQKTNLGTIKELTGLHLTANVNEPFWKLEDTIDTTANQFKNTPINGLYETTKFYDSATSTDNLRFKKQKSGNLWIIISVSDLEPNWYGQTPKIQIKLN